MESIQNELLLLLQTVGAMLLGGVIGFERELVHRPAGFRTHMMVAGASSLFVRLGEPMLRYFKDQGLGDLVEADPFRIIGAVVTGVAFLGAGTIIQRENSMKVKGLTTASSLLFAGAIGMVAAVDYWILASSLALVSVVILRLLGYFNDWLEERSGGGRE